MRQKRTLPENSSDAFIVLPVPLILILIDGDDEDGLSFMRKGLVGLMGFIGLKGLRTPTGFKGFAGLKRSISEAIALPAYTNKQVIAPNAASVRFIFNDLFSFLLLFYPDEKARPSACVFIPQTSPFERAPFLLSLRFTPFFFVFLLWMKNMVNVGGP